MYTTWSSLRMYDSHIKNTRCEDDGMSGWMRRVRNFVLRGLGVKPESIPVADLHNLLLYNRTASIITLLAVGVIWRAFLIATEISATLLNSRVSSSSSRNPFTAPLKRVPTACLLTFTISEVALHSHDTIALCVAFDTTYSHERHEAHGEKVRSTRQACRIPAAAWRLSVAAPHLAH